MNKFGLGKGLGALIPNTPPPDDNDSSRAVAEDLEKLQALQTNPEPEIQSIPEVDLTPATPTEIADEKLKEGRLGEQVVYVRTGDIFPNPYQPRKVFESQALQDLANSIKEHGIIQPLVVNEPIDGKYELVAGERRLQAAKIVGLETVPTVVKSGQMGQRQKLEVALVENIQRSDLNLIELGRGFQRLHDEFGLTYDEVADKVGRSRSSVNNIVRLLNLPIEMQRALIDGRIAEGHGRALLQVNEREKQYALFSMILNKKLTTDQAAVLAQEWTDRPYLRRVARKDSETRMLENKLRLSLNLKSVNIKRSDTGGGTIHITALSEDEFRGVVEKLNS